MSKLLKSNNYSSTYSQQYEWVFFLKHGVESLWGATLMPHRGCAMDWDKTIIARVGKNSGPVLSRLWTKVHQILRQYGRPFVLSNDLSRLSMSRLIVQ